MSDLPHCVVALPVIWNAILLEIALAILPLIRKSILELINSKWQSFIIVFVSHILIESVILQNPSIVRQTFGFSVNKFTLIFSCSIVNWNILHLYPTSIMI